MEEYPTIDSIKALLARVHKDTSKYLETLDDNELENEFESIIMMAKVAGYNCYIKEDLHLYLMELNDDYCICLNPTFKDRPRIILFCTGQRAVTYYNVDFLKKELVELL